MQENTQEVIVYVSSTVWKTWEKCKKRYQPHQQLLLLNLQNSIWMAVLH